MSSATDKKRQTLERIVSSTSAANQETISRFLRTNRIEGRKPSTPRRYAAAFVVRLSSS